MHHVILYECQGNNGGTGLDLETMSRERGRPCYQPDSPPLSCTTVVATWARGSEVRRRSNLLKKYLEMLFNRTHVKNVCDYYIRMFGSH